MEGGVSPNESTEERSQQTQREATDSEDEEFSVLEQDFKAVLQDLEQHESLATFRSEYERLFAALRRARKREQACQEQVGSLQALIDANSAKVAAAVKLSESDKQTIEQLKQELHKAWGMIDVAHDREQLALDTIESLRHQVAQQGARKDSLEGLGADKGQLLKDCEQLHAEVAQLAEQLLGVTSLKDELVKQQRLADQQISELTQELETQANETAKETRLKEKLEEEVLEVSEKLSRKASELSGLQFDLQETRRRLARLETSNNDLQAAHEGLLRDNEALQGRLQKLQAEHQTQAAALERAAEESATRAAQLKAKETQLTQLEGQLSRTNHSLEQLRKRLRGLEASRQALLQRHGKQKELVDAKKEELRLARLDVTACQRDRGQLERTNALLVKNITRAHSSAQEQTRMMQLHELAKRSLQMELERSVSENARLRKLVSSVEAERDKLVNESLELKKQIDSAADSMRLKQLEVFENMKSLAQMEADLKKQQSMYDAARDDRNALSQSLLESQAEATELKRKLKMMGHQIEQMKEDITQKERQLIKEEFALQKVEKEREALRADLKRLQQDVMACQSQIQEMQLEERKLQRAVQQGDEERQRQQKEIQQIMNERDILGTQLVRRNDELALVYEKERILRGTLDRGEVQYAQRLEDIRLLKLEIRRLRREKGLLADSVTNTVDLRQEVFHLHRDLAREQTKCRALEEELQTPLNVHRWRKLEGSDPERYELLQKVQLLQKRLVAQATVAVERENKLRELEALHQGTRRTQEHQDERSNAHILHHTQTQLRIKQRKMKGLLAELSMCECQVSEYKTGLEQVTQELKAVKKKYYIEKSTNQRRKDRLGGSRDTTTSAEEVETANGRQFIGGGFNLSASPTRLHPADQS